MTYLITSSASQDWQLYCALGVCVLVIGAVGWRRLRKKRGCGHECGCG